MSKKKAESGFEEENKEGSPRRAAQTALEILQESLPTEIQGIKYDEDGELFEALEKLNLSGIKYAL
jgi:hypothetical protein